MSSDTKLITGFIAGALIGVAAALLLAPAPGSETRSVVASRASELRRRAAEMAQRAANLRNRANDSEEEYAESDGELSRSS